MTMQTSNFKSPNTPGIDSNLVKDVCYRSDIIDTMADLMTTITVSPKFQIVIPQAIREQLHIEAGQKLQVIAYDKRIELLPVEDARALRGFMQGIETSVNREDDRV